MRRFLLVAGIALLGAAPAPDRQRRLADAKRDAAVASARAEELTNAAARERDAAARAQAEQAALATRVRAAEAQVAAAEARVALVADARSAAQARLAQAQAPAARLLAALTGLARRPTIAAVAQPGSVDDLVHVRAVLGASLPAVRARAEGIRRELQAVRRLQASAVLAAQALRDGRSQLERDRLALAQLEARLRGRAAAFGQQAVSESDRALALGERARDLVDQIAVEDRAQVTVAELASLPGPLPRPRASGAVPPDPVSGAYRLPVAGQVTTGFGEVSPAGVRSRGLTLRVLPGAPVIAPAGGVVRFARPFRGYRTIVVIDHAAGWTTLITGLDRALVQPGRSVAQGAPIGRATTAEDPQVTIELRRRGRPADIAALIG
jgi:septal ring factor EnvC (AmiA/AmiB activator)